MTISSSIQSHSLFGMALLGVAMLTSQTANANESRDDGYIGITKGGPLGAEDRMPHVDAVADSVKYQVSAEISAAEEIISANFALDIAITGRVRSDAAGNNFTVATSNISAKLSLPMNGTGSDDLVDFQTFGNDGKLTIGFNSYVARFNNPFTLESDLSILAAGCLRAAGAEWLQARPNRNAADVDAVIATYRRAISMRSIDAAMNDIGKDAAEGTFANYASNQCKQGGTLKIGSSSQYVRFAGASLEDPANRGRQSAQRTLFWGAEASIGYNRFSIIDRPARSLQVADRLGFDVNGRVGVALTDIGAIILASAGYTRSYKAQDVVQVCGPPDTTGAATCVSGQDGAPTRSDTGYATVSARYVLHRNSAGDPIIGIRPSVTYILEDKDWQLELPVYLQRNEDGGLDAGIRAIYNTGARKFGLGAFVGVPF